MEKVKSCDRIKEALRIRNMKQSELAEKTGLSKSAISQYVSGTIEPRQNGIYALSKALNVSEAWLMGFNVSMDRKSDLDRIEQSERDKIINEYELDALEQQEYDKIMNMNFLMFEGRKITEEEKENMAVLMKKIFVSSLLRKRHDDEKEKKNNKQGEWFSLVDISLLAEELIVKHGTSNPERLIKLEGIDLMFYPMDIRGLYILNCGKQTIVINPNLTKLEKYGTMYHELCHSQIHGNQDYLFMWDHIRFENDRIENEANKFAAYMIYHYNRDIELEPGDEELLEKLKTYL